MIVIIAKHFNYVEQLVNMIDHSKRTHLSILNFLFQSDLKTELRNFQKDTVIKHFDSLYSVLW